MVLKVSKASNCGARCRSPNRFISLCNVGTVTVHITSVENSHEFNLVESAGRGCGQSATKFYTKNNREGRLEISSL